MSSPSADDVARQLDPTDELSPLSSSLTTSEWDNMLLGLGQSGLGEWEDLEQNAAQDATPAAAPQQSTPSTPTRDGEEKEDNWDAMLQHFSDNSTSAPPASASEVIHAVVPQAVKPSQAALYDKYKQQQGWQSCEVDAKSKLPEHCQQVAFEDINKKVLNPKVKTKSDAGAIGDVMKTVRKQGKDGAIANNTFHLRYAAIAAYLSENQLIPPEVYSFFTAKHADNYTDQKLDTKTMRQRYKRSLHLGPKKLATGKDYRNYPIIQYGSDGGGTCTVYELKKSGAGQKASHLKTDCGGQQVRMTPELYQTVLQDFLGDKELYAGMMAELAANWRHVESKFAPHKFNAFRPVLARMKTRLCQQVECPADSNDDGGGSGGASAMTAASIPEGFTPVGQPMPSRAAPPPTAVPIPVAAAESETTAAAAPTSQAAPRNSEGQRFETV